MSPKDKMRKLLEVLHCSRRAKVSDPRDHVYGLLGITTALFGTDFMHPDYTLTAATVFTQFALALIKASGSLLILGQAFAYQNTLTNLPSFAPDWTSFYDFQAEYDRLSMWDLYRASGSLPLALRAISDREISVAYHTFKVVKHTSPPHFALLSVDVQQCLPEWFKNYLEWSMLSHTPGNGPPFQVSHSAFAMTMFRGIDWTSDCKFQAPAEAVSELKIARDGKDSLHFICLSFAMENSCFFVTSDGDPALGPINTEEGDIVALLRGGNVPYVLRRCTESEHKDSYYLVGECYVYGAMEGEKVPPDDQWGWASII